MTKNKLYSTIRLVTLAVAGVTAASTTIAQEDETYVLEEIVVTARHRVENLQDVPDAITAFSADRIKDAGIDDVQDFIDQTPNVIMRETFRAGVTLITVRGVTTGQQGWAPVTYVVDGVKAGALDAINQGALNDIERIEVLKGPQGALYGAGAIAGAINVVTQLPSNEFEAGLRLSAAEGNDYRLSGTLSGAFVEDKLLYRLGVYQRDNDGLIETTDGHEVDFEEQLTWRGRLIYKPADTLTMDFRASYSDITAGAAAQDILTSINDIDEFDTSRTPGPRRGILGEEDRTFEEFSLKVDWDTDFATLTSITGYQDIAQSLFGSASWDKPPVSNSLFGPVFGDAASAGQAIDDFQDLADNFEVFTQDVRLTSNGDGDLRWVLGAEYLKREVINKLGVGRVMGPVPGELLYFLKRFDEKEDEILGFYSQLNYDLSEGLELTVAARYDENEYQTLQFDPASGEVIPTLDEDGNAVDKLTNTDSKFQPKLQLSYDWSDDLMTYVTVAKGFRTGFFNTGNLSKAETTDNYELGFKSTLARGSAQLNGALFYIDYSDQQNTNVIATPPFRISNNIPESKMMGLELELVSRLSDSLEINSALGYMDTEIEGTQLTTPATPEWTFNLGVQYEKEVLGGAQWMTRVDYRYQGEMYLKLTTEASGEFQDDFWIEGKHYLNIRSGIEFDHWRFTGFINNALDERQANDIAAFGPDKIVRSFNAPSQWGLEAAYTF